MTRTTLLLCSQSTTCELSACGWSGVVQQEINKRQRSGHETLLAPLFCYDINHPKSAFHNPPYHYCYNKVSSSILRINRCSVWCHGVQVKERFRSNPLAISLSSQSVWGLRSTNAHVRPRYGHVRPRYGHLRPRYGHVRPRYGHITATYGHVTATYGHQWPPGWLPVSWS